MPRVSSLNVNFASKRVHTQYVREFWPARRNYPVLPYPDVQTRGLPSISFPLAGRIALRLPAGSQRVSLFCIRVNSFVIMIFIDESCTEVLRVGAEVIRRSVFSSARKCGIPSPSPSPNSTLFHSLAFVRSRSLASSPSLAHALSVVFAYSLHGLLEYCAELRLHGIYGIRWHSVANVVSHRRTHAVYYCTTGKTLATLTSIRAS